MVADMEDKFGKTLAEQIKVFLSVLGNDAYVCAQ